ncbi:DNA-formamidopyrimidine glycosylase family protein [Nocardia vermiculata]|uniref:DNA-(apurinic or apyrimidinic site) lyase n=1 Tax=Nocardia vermiculata TaxID=257274 RepID=A0A846Y1V4_9NOCA|nr:DNA-formamidopyrimidine glycosylase family protein [Nocardia vermiculata]NKY50569.1 Fpg/Nei family DNA glycosylase [Nocardia vermiculata]
MPEGDIVYRTAAALRAALAGQTVVRSDIRVPRYATLDLRGDRIDSVGSYGKHLFVRTDRLSIHTHLKMEGSWQIYRPGQRWTKPGFTARLIITTDTAEAVGFSLGLVEVLPAEREHTAVEQLGPDLLGANWDPDEAVRRLHAHPQQSIGSALLDQRNLAGIGNIYRSEICFAHRVHPAVPVEEVADLPGLVRTSQRILTRAAHDPPWSAAVYGRRRRPCRRCGSLIAAQQLGTPTQPPGTSADPTDRAERTAYFCPRCQPLP